MLAIIAMFLIIIGIVLLVLLVLWWFCKFVCCRGHNKRDGCERCMIYAAPIMFIFAGNVRKFANQGPNTKVQAPER